jgi:hypothetical protein
MKVGLSPVEGQRRIAQVEGQRLVFVRGEPSGTKTRVRKIVKNIFLTR